jgi:26S proteasome non-ATPase regulatory subunit 9
MTSTLRKVCPRAAIGRNSRLENIVRTTRVRIIHLRNDHKEVMQLLEKGVHAHFANLQNTPGAGPTTNGTSESPAVQSLPNHTVASTSAPGAPFAKVNSVVSGSPADQAGLKAGDAIRSFGVVNWLNHERLTKVAETVQQNEGVCTHFSSHSSIEKPKCLTRSLYL